MLKFSFELCPDANCADSLLSHVCRQILTQSSGAPRIGFAAIPAAQIVKGELVEGWIDLKDEYGAQVGMRGKKVNGYPLCFAHTAGLISIDIHTFLQSRSDMPNRWEGLIWCGM